MCCLIQLSNTFWIRDVSGGNHCLRHPTKPEYVGRGGKSTGQLLPSRHRGGPWRLHIQPTTPIWLVLWSWSSQECSEGLKGLFFLVRFLRLREKIFRRSRHLTDSIWRSICLGGEERGDRRPTLRICNETKFWFPFWGNQVDIGDIFDSNWLSWLSWSSWSSWSSWPSWHRSEAEVKKETPGTMHYIYVALKQPKKIDALPCGYPPRPSR